MHKKVKYLVDNLEDLVIAVFFCGMCFFVFIQIISRYIFRSPLIYTDEAARYCYVWICFFGMAVSTKLENHIKIDLVEMLIKGKAKAIIRLFINSASLVLYAIITVIGYNYTTFNSIQLSPAMEISKAFIYASLPLGAFLSIVRLSFIIKKDVKNLLAK